LIVYSIQRVPKWTLANVCDEIYQALSPAFTNGDAAPTVSFVSDIVRVIAALKHSLPGYEGGVTFPSFGAVMFMVAHFTTARTISTMKNLSNGMGASVSAITFTEPQYAAARISIAGRPDRDE
jgi:hypothetical protein